MNRIEILADAITEYSGFRDPRTEAYRARNPGGLRAFSTRHRQTPDGLRIFDSMKNGYEALINDLEIKCGARTGKTSWAGVGPESRLSELVHVMGLRDATTGYVASFVRKATGIDTVNRDTPLTFFLEGLE